MCRFGKVFLRVFSIVAAVAGVLSVIYFWNLDQKLMGVQIWQRPLRPQKALYRRRVTHHKKQRNRHLFRCFLHRIFYHCSANRARKWRVRSCCGLSITSRAAPCSTITPPSIKIT